MNFAMMVHGSQDFTFHKPVVAGDRITTTASVKSIEENWRQGLLRIHNRVGGPGRQSCRLR